MFDLPDSWVWDFWFVDDGDRYHVFFLYASRALHDPEDRHRRASIGHAISDDLVAWERTADALVHDFAPAFDDVATWTGSVVRDPQGLWRMFYTGVQQDVVDGRPVQRIGMAFSDDLMTWHRFEGNPLVEADPRWYEKLNTSTWRDETWRDPWVYPDPDGDGWHMLVTARAGSGPALGSGVVGHAVSTDLTHWEVREPLSAPSAGFEHLEVMQVEEIDGRAVMIFSCAPDEVTLDRRLDSPRAAIWAAPADSVTGPFRLADAYPISDDDLYVGRLIRQREGGHWLFLAFRNLDVDGRFVGGIIDPLRIGWVGDRLRLCPLPLDEASEWNSRPRRRRRR